MTTAAITATRIPARMSSQKWLPVAITANQTHAGHSSQIVLDHQCRHTSAIVIPTISASAECREGIAAYGFAANWTNPLPWLTPPMFDITSRNPNVGNILGGAVGTTT